MSEDRLLSDLARVAREEGGGEGDRLEERWDRLSAGTLTAKEEAELRALAEASPEAREAYEAFRPLGADFQARMVAAISSGLEGRAPAAASAKPRSNRLLFRRAAPRLWGWLAASGTVAASVLLVLLRVAGGPGPLPAYAARFVGGTETYRGEEGPPTGPPVFVPGSLLTLEVRPERPVRGPVAVEAFLARDGELMPWEPRPAFEIADGAAHLQGTLGEEVRLSPGHWRVWVLVGRPGKMPAADEVRREIQAGRTRHGSWQAVAADLRVEGRPSS